MRGARSLRFVAKCSAVIALSVCHPGVIGIAAPSFADAEFLLLKALREIRATQLDTARNTIGELLTRHPNFRLAHLIHGDLLLAKVRPLQSLGNAEAAPTDALLGLRAEASARVQRVNDSVGSDKIPANFLRLPADVRFAMAVDVNRSRIYVFENSAGRTTRIADFYATIGKEGSGKVKQGDQRTPIGAYFLQSAVPRDKLTDFYGAGAFPLDYPNAWDRRQNRNGYGIWLHGVGSDTFARAPRASDGCIVVSNPDLKLLERFIVADRTPIVVAQSIDWVDREAGNKRAQSLLTAVERWRGDWQAIDLPKYFSHYSNAFANESADYNAWTQARRSLVTNMQWAKVELTNVSAVQYPGERDLALVTFDQSFKSNKFNSQLRKRQLWQQIDGRWQIIFESNA
jgi:murein L,D-transpeptidase YafK